MNSRLLLWSYLLFAITFAGLAYPALLAQNRIAAFYGLQTLDLPASHMVMGGGVLLLCFALLALFAIMFRQMSVTVTSVLLCASFGLFIVDVIAVSRGTAVQLPFMFTKMIILLGVSGLLFRVLQIPRREKKLPEAGPLIAHESDEQDEDEATQLPPTLP